MIFNLGYNGWVGETHTKSFFMTVLIAQTFKIQEHEESSGWEGLEKGCSRDEELEVVWSGWKTITGTGHKNGKCKVKKGNKVQTILLTINKYLCCLVHLIKAKTIFIKYQLMQEYWQ